MGAPGLELKQSLERLRWICRKHGISKGGKHGIVPHGLRHQFGCDLYFDHSGMPAPVLGKLAAAVYQARHEEHKAAMLYEKNRAAREREAR